MEQNLRIPRPKNATNLAYQYRKSNTYLNKKRLYTTIITHYINNDYKYQNQPTDLQSFSSFTKIPIHLIHKEMFSRIKNTQILTEDQVNSVAQGILNQALKWGLEDGLFSRLILDGLAPGLLLRVAKGQQPIGLLNSTAKHMEVSIQRTKMLLELADKLQKQPNILIQNNTLNQTINNTQYLTVDKALELLDNTANGGQLLDGPSQQAYLTEHRLKEIEDIRARNTDEGLVAVNLPKVSEELLKDIDWKD